MSKRNLTIQLDEEVIARAKVMAARRGTSMSQFVAQQLVQAADAEERYEDAWQTARRTMHEMAVHGGGRRWQRDDLYDI